MLRVLVSLNADENKSIEFTHSSEVEHVLQCCLATIS